MTTIFPAYAGVNRGLSAQSGSSGNLPRVCGGEPEKVSAGHYGGGIFPAYAGVNRRGRVDPEPVVDLPRVCGGEPRCCFAVYIDEKSSPRMRG